MKLDDYAPRTIAQAVDALNLVLDNPTKQVIMTEGSDSFHHGLGTSIRNAWGLWAGNTALYESIRDRYGVSHADDMSGLILLAFYCHLHSWDYDDALTAKAQEYRDHWIENGCDPLTAGLPVDHPQRGKWSPRKSLLTAAATAIVLWAILAGAWYAGSRAGQQDKQKFSVCGSYIASHKRVQALEDYCR